MATLYVFPKQVRKPKSGSTAVVHSKRKAKRTAAKKTPNLHIQSTQQTEKLQLLIRNEKRKLFGILPNRKKTDSPALTAYIRLTSISFAKMFQPEKTVAYVIPEDT